MSYFLINPLKFYIIILLIGLLILFILIFFLDGGLLFDCLFQFLKICLELNLIIYRKVMVKVEKFLALIFFFTILHYVIFIQYLDF